MPTSSHLAQAFSLSALSLIACTTTTDATQTASARDQAAAALARLTGAPVALETGVTGDVRVLAMTPQFALPGHATDPVVAATSFLATHHDVFQLDPGD